MRRSPQYVSTASTSASSSSSARRPLFCAPPKSQMASRQGRPRSTPWSATSAMSSSGALLPSSRSRSSRLRKRRVATISSRRLSRSSVIRRWRNDSAVSTNSVLEVCAADATTSRSTLP